MKINFIKMANGKFLYYVYFPNLKALPTNNSTLLVNPLKSTGGPVLKVPGHQGDGGQMWYMECLGGLTHEEHGGEHARSSHGDIWFLGRGS